MKNIKNLYRLIFLALFLIIFYKLEAAQINLSFSRNNCTAIGFETDKYTKEDLNLLAQRLCSMAEETLTNPEVHMVFDVGVIYDRGNRDKKNPESARYLAAHIYGWKKNKTKDIEYFVETINNIIEDLESV